MRRNLLDATYYLLISIPLVYFGMLFIYASRYYQSYYGSLTEIPFDFYSLAMGGILSIAALVFVYLMATRQRKVLIQTHTDEVLTLQLDLEEYKNQLVQERQNHKNLIAGFLVAQKLETVFNSDLFEDLQRGAQIKVVEQLSGGYSGAQVYLVHHKEETRVPDILKVAEKEEIDNEYQKFIDHVLNKLSIGPHTGIKYPWGSYGGLVYNLNRREHNSHHLSFFELYRECLYGNTSPPVGVDTIKMIIKQRLFEELQVRWNWQNLGRVNVNIYQEYYPFTEKFSQINAHRRKYFMWGQANLGLNAATWDTYKQTLDRLLDIAEWDARKLNNLYRRRIARATIHGDLNSRNILLEVGPTNHNEIRTIGLVDFSHTGNGLTKERTNRAITNGIQLDTNQGHIANDFCRLEADIKFCLTDLNDEQELRRAWILECLLLEQGLELHDWEKLQSDHEFGRILREQGLSHEVKWEELSDPSCWTEDQARKFVLVWRSVKAIRDALREILQGAPPSMQPFHLALLQASLTMIYYEDERFHNANLQKLYIVLASGLLCKELR